MNKPTILVFGTSEEQNQLLVKALANEFTSVTATTDEMAIERFQQSNFDAVVFGNNVTATQKAKLEKLFSMQADSIVFVDADKVAVLATDIHQKIAHQRKANKPTFSFKDDTLKNAGLNIEIQ